MRLTGTLAVLIIFWCTTASAQPYYSRHYQVETGLSNNTVQCSIQGSKDFSNYWTTLLTSRRIYFAALTAGNYKLIVRSLDDNISDLTLKTVLTIIIQPPFWASTWAYIVYFILTVTALIFIIRRYHQHTNEKHRLNHEREIYNSKINFFTHLAHEIRTPLTLIKGPMDVIKEKAAEVPGISDNLQIMEKNTDLLLSLTNQLLDFRKIESNEFNLSFVRCDINELVSNTFVRYTDAIDQKKLAVEINLCAHSLYAYVDVDALSKIISNLLDNAVKYSKRQIIIQVLEAEQQFSVTIINDGDIIPEYLSEKIFEPFFRSKDSTHQQGSGIGLPFARSLAKIHGGTLILQAGADNVNVFKLTVPIGKSKDMDEPAVEVESPLNPTKYTILVVDDNTEILQFISFNLGNDYNIITRTDAAKVIDLLSEELVHLVISDIMMPGTDGYELCKAIKSSIDHSHIPVILLTAKNNLQAKIMGLTCGADAYIEKPFSLAYLRAQINNLIVNHQKVRDFSTSPRVNISSLACSEIEEGFLEKLNKLIDSHLHNTELDVDHLADMMHMGRRTFYRKIKAISDLSPTELINIARLKKAASLLLETDHKIYTICRMIGYSSEESLRRNFTKQFGMAPSEYARQAGQSQHLH